MPDRQQLGQRKNPLTNWEERGCYWIKNPKWKWDKRGATREENPKWNWDKGGEKTPLTNGLKGAASRLEGNKNPDRRRDGAGRNPLLPDMLHHPPRTLPSFSNPVPELTQNSYLVIYFPVWNPLFFRDDCGRDGA